jgi:hypothetical protein
LLDSLTDRGAAHAESGHQLVFGGHQRARGELLGFNEFGQYFRDLSIEWLIRIFTQGAQSTPKRHLVALTIDYNVITNSS